MNILKTPLLHLISSLCMTLHLGFWRGFAPGMNAVPESFGGLQVSINIRKW
jgi:hypothetical protein